MVNPINAHLSRQQGSRSTSVKPFGLKYIKYISWIIFCLILLYCVLLRISKKKKKKKSIAVGQINEGCHMTCQRRLHCCQPAEGSEGEVGAKETASASGGGVSQLKQTARYLWPRHTKNVAKARRYDHSVGEQCPSTHLWSTKTNLPSMACLETYSVGFTLISARLGWGTMWGCRRPIATRQLRLQPSLSGSLSSSSPILVGGQLFR